jgi:hypothetical protein
LNWAGHVVTGQAVNSVWYELVPAVQVPVTISDLTRHATIVSLAAFGR